jgi:hypothetical protein
MATDQATGQAPGHVKRPAPLVSPLRHPLKWLGITFLSVLIALVLAHVASLMISGLYYAIFEWNGHVTRWWHSFISDSGLRHAVRDVAEGFYGGAIAQQLVWNAFRRRTVRYRHKPMTRLDRIEDFLRIPNLRSPRKLSFWQIPYALLLWAPLYGSAGFFVVYFLDGAIRHDFTILQHSISGLSRHPTLWQRVESIDNSNWDKKLMGLAASFFFGRRPLRRVFDGVQLWFAQRHVASGKPMRWYYPPTFRARCNDVAEQVQAGQMTVSDRHATLQAVLLTAALVPVVVFAGLGFYVLTFVATKAA